MVVFKDSEDINRKLESDNFKDSDYAKEEAFLNRNMRDLSYDTPCGMQTTLDRTVGKYSQDYDDIRPEDIKKTGQLIEDETKDMIKDIDDIVQDIEFLSKKEKKAVKRVLLKRVETIKQKFKDDLENSKNGFSTWLEDIETQLDDDFQELRDAVALILDITVAKTTVWKKKNHYVTKTYGKNFSCGMPEVKSDRKIKIKVDKESLEQFLCQSDGNLENIAMITADNREFKDIEDVIFKMVPVERKTRQHAYTECDGRDVADMLNKNGLTKCGWIHTHPFSKSSTFFSGLDTDTTKEMCVLPDDYALAIVVGCRYLPAVSRMEDGVRVITEQEVEWSLGSMIFQKQTKDGKIMKLSDEGKDNMTMVKYEVEIEIVDKDGKPMEYKNLQQDNSIMERQAYDTFTPAVQWGLENCQLTPGAQKHYGLSRSDDFYD